MIYTQQRRKLMNKAVAALYPDIRFYENSGSIPVMECDTLPAGAKHIIDADDLIGHVKEHCVRTNEMGTRIPDYGKAFPVFIRSMELNGKNSSDTRIYYRVNFVSLTESSLNKAEEYISAGKLYAVI